MRFKFLSFAIERNYRASVPAAVDNLCATAATDAAKERMRGLAPKRASKRP